MKELDLSPIKELLAKITPYPWEWREDQFRPKYMVKMKNGNWRAKPGRSANQSWVMLLTGPCRLHDKKEFTQEDILKHYPDEYDFTHIIALRWEQIRGKSLFNATPLPEDAKLIAEAPMIIRSLIEEIERLRGKE